LATTARFDYRISRIFGPIIHYSTNTGGAEELSTVIEESLHYLQWVNQLSPDSLDAMAEMAKDLELPNNGCRPEGKFFLSSFSPDKDPFSGRFQKQYKQKLEQVRNELLNSPYEEKIAGSVLYEAAAELLRIEFGVSEPPSSYINYEEWAERGIPGWTERRKNTPNDDLAPQPLSDVDDIRACYESMKELSWEDFLREVSRRSNVKNLQDLEGLTRMINLVDNPLHPSSGGLFPQTFAHFLGYTLGQELHKSGIFSDPAGLQEASLTFFSYLHQPSVRLLYLKELLLR
jgi:hypothetical protein